MGKNISTKEKNKTNGRMKEIITNTLLVIVTGLIIYSIMVVTTIKTDVGTHYKKINTIQLKIDSANRVNRELDLKIAKIDSNISVLNNELVGIEKNINIIKKQTNDKVASVDTFSYNQLKEFFTKRYDPNISK
jgi:hypothetical protein